MPDDSLAVIITLFEIITYSHPHLLTKLAHVEPPLQFYKNCTTKHLYIYNHYIIPYFLNIFYFPTCLFTPI